LSRYAAATREELWSRGRLVERRLEHGEAIERGGVIDARDVRDDALVAWCDAELERLRVACELPLVRLVAEASTEGAWSLIVIGGAVVTDAAHYADDVRLMRPAGTANANASDIVWRNGSAAVLLHEAIGHAREHGHAELAWPPWLRVDVPLAMRRASFRDVPLLRMKELVASQDGAPFALPRRRIEVQLVDGGAYEPLTETVSLRIAAADLVDGDLVTPLAPFDIRETRQRIARAIVGASGEPLRYPGVICSREGQELFVASHAPVLHTRFP
jgi:hypothetical protein